PVAVKAAPAKAVPKKAAPKKPAPKKPAAKSAPAKAVAKKTVAKSSAGAKASPPAKSTAAAKAPAPARTPAKAPNAPPAAEKKRSTVICPLSGFEVKPDKPNLSPRTIERLQAKLLDERARHLHQADEFQAEAEALAIEREGGDTQFDEESGEGDT